MPDPTLADQAGIDGCADTEGQDRRHEPEGVGVPLLPVRELARLRQEHRVALAADQHVLRQAIERRVDGCLGHPLTGEARRVGQAAPVALS